MQHSTFVTGLRDAYEHAGGIKTLHLGKLDPEWFAQIQREALSIISSSASSDVGAPTHVTNWTRPKGKIQQFSLFNSSGRSEDYQGDYGYRGDVTKKQLVFPHLSGLKRFASLFGKSLRNLRLNGMGTASSLSAHEENSIEARASGSTYIVRFHLPIFSSKNAYVYLDDERYHYLEGHLYFFHHGCVHAAANFGEEPRYHLVLDCFLDRELFRNLFSAAPSLDAGFLKSIGEDTRVPSEPHRFPDFVCENGKVVSNGIRYGRRAPTIWDFYRKNYPSIFGVLGKKEPMART